MLMLLPAIFPALIMQALGLILPGPDFALILSSALTKNRQYTYAVALGLACGLLAHASYSIYLLPSLLQNNHIVLTFIKYIGCVYLLYLSIIAFKAGFTYKKLAAGTSVKEEKSLSSKFKGFFQGFLCNVCNPKAVLFYVSIFTVVLANESNLLTKNICAGVMFLMGYVWFSLLALLFMRPNLKQRLEKLNYFYKTLYFLTGTIFLIFSCVFFFIPV